MFDRLNGGWEGNEQNTGIHTKMYVLLTDFPFYGWKGSQYDMGCKRSLLITLAGHVGHVGHVRVMLSNRPKCSQRVRVHSLKLMTSHTEIMKTFIREILRVLVRESLQFYKENLEQFYNGNLS